MQTVRGTVTLNNRSDLESEIARQVEEKTKEIRESAEKAANTYAQHVHDDANDHLLIYAHCATSLLQLHMFLSMQHVQHKHKHKTLSGTLFVIARTVRTCELCLVELV